MWQIGYKILILPSCAFAFTLNAYMHTCICKAKNNKIKIKIQMIVVNKQMRI